MSADTKRTEGPWRWVEDSDLGRSLVGPSYEPTARRAERHRAALLCATGGVKSDYTIDAHDDVEALAASAPDLYAALEKALPLLEACAEGESCYGHFPGGDPRKFSPDEESNTPEEMAAWKAACERWNAGDHTETGTHGRRPVSFTREDGTPALGFACGSSFGVGVYQYADGAATAALDAARAALAKARGEAA